MRQETSQFPGPEVDSVKGLWIVPSVSATGQSEWVIDNVLATGILDSYGTQIHAVTVERYPNNNCVAIYGGGA